jgi:hypothetical protein
MPTLILRPGYGLEDSESGFTVVQGQNFIFLYSLHSSSPGDTEECFLGLKPQGSEFDYPAVSIAETQN